MLSSLLFSQYRRIHEVGFKSQSFSKKTSSLTLDGSLPLGSNDFLTVELISGFIVSLQSTCFSNVRSFILQPFMTFLTCH